MRGQRKNPRKAVQPFENKKRKIDIFKNYEANGVEKIQRKLEIFSTLISKKSKKIMENFKENLMDAVVEMWNCHRRPLLLSQIPSQLKLEKPVKEVLEGLSLKEYLDELIDGGAPIKYVRHPTQKAKIGLIPSEEDYSYQKEEPSSTKHFKNKYGDDAFSREEIRGILKFLGTISSEDREKIFFSAEVLQNLLKKIQL